MKQSNPQFQRLTSDLFLANNRNLNLGKNTSSIFKNNKQPTDLQKNDSFGPTPGYNDYDQAALQEYAHTIKTRSLSRMSSINSTKTNSGFGINKILNNMQ